MLLLASGQCHIVTLDIHSYAMHNATRIRASGHVAIRTWACEDTRAIFEGESPNIVPRNLLKRAHARLLMLNAAMEIRDMSVPPGNRLEKLRGAREGQHSIRINIQYRVCFVWRSGDAYQVEIVDYH